MSAFLQSLADALNASEADVRAALERFAVRLRERVAEEGSATYHGLGTFRREGVGLAFEPDESVALVINHRYAGMEPIALSEGTPPTWQPGLPDDEHPLGAPAPGVFEDVPFEEAEDLSEVPPGAVPLEDVPDMPFEDAPLGSLPFEDAPAEEAVAEPSESEEDFGAPEEEEEAVWSDIPPPASAPELPPLFASDETLMALRDAAREMEETTPSEEADAWAAQMIEEEEAAPAPAAPEEEDDDLPPPPLSRASVPVEAHVEMPQEYDPDSEGEAGEVPAPRPAVLPITPPAAPPPEPPRPALPPERAEPERTRRFPWLPALLLVLLVGAVVAMLFLRTPAPVERPTTPPIARADTMLTPDTVATAPATPADTSAEEPADATPPAAPAPEAAAQPPPPAAATQPETPAARPEARPAPPAEADGALRGSEPVTAGHGYTLIIGGGTQSEASRIAEPFRQQGYRTGVLAGRTDAGKPIYRAAVGQFGSVREAQAAMRRVPGLPSGAWILNLRSTLVRSE